MGTWTFTEESRSDLWWKNAIVYCLDVETFFDANGDGVGDGLTDRLDYLSGLGVTCLWLLPFYPSPNCDDGYDVSDFYGVEPRLGTLGDVAEFLHRARMRGIRVVIDLVVNHTSDQHPWFQQARSDPNSPYRSYYVWSDQPQPEPRRVVFPGESNGNWTYDETAGQYYLHRYHDFQPDLNIADARFRREIRRMMAFWLELGVAGFRVDSAPFVIETAGIQGEFADDPHDYLRDLRGFIGQRAGNVALIGEANVPLDRLAGYFGEAGAAELDLLFNFRGTAGLFLSLARETADPLRTHLETLPVNPPTAQWANFLCNHDELSVEFLASHEREAVFDAFAPEADMRAYGRGIRRRLAPILGGDRRKIELAWSLLLSLPGTPVLYYGEEIGMGENLALPGRLAVRTPMQWRAGSTCGFSPAEAGRLVRRLVEGEYGPERINVAAQGIDPGSLLNWTARAIRTRKQAPELGRGRFCAVDTDDAAVLAHRVDYEGQGVVAVHNFSADERRARLPLEGDVEVVGDLLADQVYEAKNLSELAVAGYGYRWIRFHAG